MGNDDSATLNRGPKNNPRMQSSAASTFIRTLREASLIKDVKMIIFDAKGKQNREIQVAR